MTIGQLADELNDVIRLIETELANLETIGNTEKIKYSRGEFRLAFGKLEGMWRLLVRYVEGDTVLPLLSASIEIRCSAIEHLDELRAAMLKYSEEQSVRIMAASVAARRFFEKIRVG